MGVQRLQAGSTVAIRIETWKETVASPVLYAPSGGVRITITGPTGVVVASLVAMTAESTGVYTYSHQSATDAPLGDYTVTFKVIDATVGTSYEPVTVGFVLVNEVGVATSPSALTGLNADYLLGQTWAAPGAIGSGTANTGAFTTLTATSLTTTADVTARYFISSDGSNGLIRSGAGSLFVRPSSSSNAVIFDTGIVAVATSTPATDAKLDVRGPTRWTLSNQTLSAPALAFLTGHGSESTPFPWPIWVSNTQTTGLAQKGYTLYLETLISSTAPTSGASGAIQAGTYSALNVANQDLGGILGFINFDSTVTTPAGQAMWGLIRGNNANFAFGDGTVSAVSAGSEVVNGQHPSTGFYVFNSDTDNAFKHAIWVSSATTYGLRIGYGSVAAHVTDPTWAMAVTPSTGGGLLKLAVDMSGRTFINAGATALPSSTISGYTPLIQIGGESGSGPIPTLLIDGAVTSAGIRGRRSGGTFASPAATATGVNMFVIEASGWESTNTYYGPAAARLAFEAVSGHTNTDHSTLFKVSLTPVGSTTLAAAFTVTSEGALRPKPFAIAAIATVLAANGDFGYCTDCQIANPCVGGGTGAIAKRLNGVNVCD